jgi:phosphatidylglycerol:prolipoprotein diacylglycerol transferase
MYPAVVIYSGLLIPTYLLINSFAFCLAVIWIHIRAKKSELNHAAVLDVTLVTMVGGFVGARIFHIFFERPDFYFQNPDYVFKFWYGGFVFYGGLIGGSLACTAACRIRKVSILKCADLFAPVLAFGYAIGRLGCFAAGCCYGRPTNLPWAVHFPAGVEAPALIGLHPTQLYSSLGSLIILAILLLSEKCQKRKPGQLFGLWLLLQSVVRVFIERFRDDFRGPNVFNLSVATWLSILSIFVALILLREMRLGNLLLSKKGRR